jgi:hypothetical protein
MYMQLKNASAVCIYSFYKYLNKIYIIYLHRHIFTPWYNKKLQKRTSKY